MRINSNIASLQARRAFSQTNIALARSLERLSSGQRINRAGDDASGLALSEGIRSQVRAFRSSIININQAMGFLSTAQGSITTQMEIVQRMRELSMQSANGTLSSKDRSYLNTDFQQILEEFKRIADSSRFNGTNLLDGSTSNFDIQVGPRKENRIEIQAIDTRANSVFQKRVNNGVFDEEETLDIGVGAEVVKTADLDGDGKSEIISVDGSGALVIQKQTTSGQWISTVDSDVGDSPVDFELADLTGNGVLDIVIATAGLGGGPSEIIVKMGAGDGTFGESQVVATGVEFSAVRLGDLSKSGRRDIVATDFGSSQFKVFKNLGGGSFASEVAYSTGDSPSDLQLADLNKDGFLDVITADFGDGQISVRYGSSDGTFGAATTFAAGNNPLSLAVGDIDGDGNLDVATSDAGDQTVSILKGNGSGGFEARTSFSVSGLDQRKLILADTNSSGILDVVLANGTDSSASIYRSEDGTSFSLKTTLALGGGSVNSLALLPQEDGDVFDLVIADNGSGELQLYQGLDRFDSATSDLDISSQESAQIVLSILDDALSALSERLATLGAQTNRLESAGRVTSISQENLSGALSQIRDLDYGSEVSELTRFQILQQAQAAVMGQANSSMQAVLTLLRV